MEEDIKLLEEMKTNCRKKDSEKCYIDEKAERKAQAIENIIKGYKEKEKELEKYKKIAEKLAEVVDLGMIDFNCGMCVHDNCIKECALEWAKKEVENG